MLYCKRLLVSFTGSLFYCLGITKNELYSSHVNKAVSSITKNKQSSSTLISIVKYAFDLSISEKNITELGDGYCNAIYEISFDSSQRICTEEKNPIDASSVILKIAPAPSIEMMTYEENLLKTEIEVIQLLNKVSSSSSQEVTLKIPKLLFYDSSCTLCNAPYFFMTKIEGKTISNLPRQPQELQNTFAATLGTYLKIINSIQSDHFGIINCPQTFSKTNEEFVLKIFRMLLDDGIKKQCDLKAIDYDSMWNLISSNKDIFENGNTPCLVHWDLWEGNVFVKENEVSGIIDFERALWGDPLMEQEFSNFLPPRKAFLQSYGKQNFTDKEKIRCQFYKIYRELSMIIECSYRHYESEAQYTWVTAELKKDILLLQNMINNYRMVGN